MIIDNISLSIQNLDSNNKERDYTLKRQTVTIIHLSMSLRWKDKTLITRITSISKLLQTILTLIITDFNSNNSHLSITKRWIIALTRMPLVIILINHSNRLEIYNINSIKINKEASNTLEIHMHSLRIMSKTQL